MMKYVLVIIYLTGYGPKATIAFQEFETLEKCQKAETVIAKDIQWYRTPNMYCMEK